MPQVIIKPKPDEDFYVVWTTVTDSAIYWGPRAEVEAEYEHATPARFDRADQYGTSAQWSTFHTGDEPWRAYGWADSDRTLTPMEGFDRRDDYFASLNIDDLREWCESYRDGKFTALHLIEWEAAE